jgi:hypothetical protein
VVECNLPKVEVAGSNPVSRFYFFFRHFLTFCQHLKKPIKINSRFPLRLLGVQFNQNFSLRFLGSGVDKALLCEVRLPRTHEQSVNSNFQQLDIKSELNLFLVHRRPASGGCTPSALQHIFRPPTQKALAKELYWFVFPKGAGPI